MADEHQLQQLKERGNAAFKIGEYSEAKTLYSEVIKKCTKSTSSTLKATLLCNRAACSLRLDDFEGCIADCTMALDLDRTLTKALYRRAVAFEAQKDFSQSFKDLAALLHMDPKNSQGITLMRKVKMALEVERSNSSTVQNILDAVKKVGLREHGEVQDSNSISTSETARSDSVKLSVDTVCTALSSLISLCYEEKHHALDFARRGGLLWLRELINGEMASTMGDAVGAVGNRNLCKDESINCSDTILLSAVRVLSASSNHAQFVRLAIDMVSKRGGGVGVHEGATSRADQPSNAALQLNPDGQYTFGSICSLLPAAPSSVVAPLIVLIMNILRHGFPVTVQERATLELQIAAKKQQQRNKKQENGDRGQAMTAAGSADEGADEMALQRAEYTLGEESAKALLHSCCLALSRTDSSTATARSISSSHANDAQTFSVITDAIGAFLSDCADYVHATGKDVDTRMEGIEERKHRLKVAELLTKRSKTHAKWAVECGILDQLIRSMDCSASSSIRINASSCLGKVVNYHGDGDELKVRLKPYLPGHQEQLEPSESKRVVELLDDEDGAQDPISVADCRLRAALEAALLIANPDLGSWALQEPGGVKQLLLLVATGDSRCQEVAAEVICLASAITECSSLLSSVVSSGTLTTLLHAAQPGTRAAAASTVTKLALKAKALSEDSAEVAQVLNTALGVIKAANATSAKITASATASAAGSGAAGSGSGSGSASNLVSFSHMDTVHSSQEKLKQRVKQEEDALRKQLALLPSSADGGVDSSSSSGVTMTAVERAVEALAALVGKSYVKEEIVHGSYRVSSCVAELTKLDLDSRSTAAYGISHILCALTVTNRELRMAALADKGVTMEQFEQLQELQRIKTKDEDGNPIEEKKEEEDTDSADMCRRRIQRLVACDTIKFLVRLLTGGGAGSSSGSSGGGSASSASSGGGTAAHKNPSSRSSINSPSSNSTSRTSSNTSSISSSNSSSSSGGGRERSSQTKEAAVRVLRQICVEPSARGVMIQQGGFKACCTLAADEDVQRSTRLEAAHAVAKALVTTNPNVLSEHLRLGAIRPLLMLCRESQASNLQQFEALLALTNILSCGQPEQDKLAAEKGVGALHYLVFSDHPMVRRAATEALCNMPTHESVLKLLRSVESVKLWLGLSEEWDKQLDDDDDDDDAESHAQGVSSSSRSSSSSGAVGGRINKQDTRGGLGKEKGRATPAGGSLQQDPQQPPEPFLTARAASGTLAVAASDAGVARALLKSDCARTIVSLLNSEQPELVHRALVWITTLIEPREEDDEVGACGDGDEPQGAGQRQKASPNSDRRLTLQQRAAMHLVEGGVVPAIGVVVKLQVPQLGSIAKQAAQLLSAVISSADRQQY